MQLGWGGGLWRARVLQGGVSHHWARLLVHNLTPPESPAATLVVPSRLVALVAHPVILPRSLCCTNRRGTDCTSGALLISGFQGLSLDLGLVGHTCRHTLGG